MADKSAAIAQRLQPFLTQATRVAGYLAVGSEVDLSPVRSSLADTQHYCVPLVKPGNRLVFVHLKPDTPLKPGSFGIMEPDVDDSAHVELATIDVVLVPLVGFDWQCNRMGMGGGYYDRAFALPDNSTVTAARPLLIGVAFDQQEAPSVFPDWWDVTLDHVVTESRVLNRPV